MRYPERWLVFGPRKLEAEIEVLQIWSLKSKISWRSRALGNLGCCKMHKHILFIVENNSFPSDVRVLRQALAAKEFGYDVSVISPRDKIIKERFQETDGIDTYQYPRLVEGASKAGLIFEYINAFFWEFVLSVRVFIKKRFDIIHAANPPDFLFLIALPYKLLGVKFIFDHHDLSPETFVAKFGKKGVFYYLLLILEWLTFKTADIVISTNESYKKIALERGGRGYEDIFVVRNGPDLSSVTFSPGNDFWKKGFKYLVAYVGTIGTQECVDVLLRCVKYIVYDKGIKDIRFVIIGQGPSLSQMVGLSKSIGVDQYVEFTGFVSYEKFYEILATADLCVNPEHINSFTDKSTMLKIMDYMTMGKPIIQFNTTEGRVTAGDSAIYIDNNDEIAFAEAIIALLDDPVKRRRMGEIGRKRIFEKLHWGEQKDNLKQVYENLRKYS